MILKRTMRKLALRAMMLLVAATASAGVKTTYNFVLAPDATPVLPTWGDEVLVHGDIALNLLAYGTKTFDNRFAIGPTSRNSDTGNGFKFRTSGDWKGLWSQHADRNFSILDLKKGDKVTLTISKNETTLKFVDGDAVESGKEYTVEADGTMDFVSTGGVYIESVSIETKGVAVSIGIIPTVDPTVYNFVLAEEGSTAAPTFGDDVSTGGATLQKISYGTQTFDNKFAVGPKNRNTGTDGGFIFRTADSYKGLYSKWNARNFSILDLKKGETVTMVISNNTPNMQFVGGDVVVSGKSYTVSEDGNMNFVTLNGSQGTYIERVIIMAAGATGTSAGTTMVTPTALDFTNSTISAYIATAVNAGAITFKRVYKVPKDTPLLLMANNTTPMTEVVAELDGEAEDVSNNLMKGSATESTDLVSDENTKYYVYGTHDKKAAFYYASSMKSQDGKVYLELTTAQAGAARFLDAIFDGTTGISEVRSKMEAVSGVYYNLAGLRIDNPTKGIYIVNGQKVVIK